LTRKTEQPARHQVAGKSKKLTVSYGAFSCSLEGFEDSVDVMKSVTEFIGEIAARNPQFGTAPAPLPTSPLPAPAEPYRIPKLQREHQLERDVSATQGDPCDKNMTHQDEAAGSTSTLAPLKEATPTPEQVTTAAAPSDTAGQMAPDAQLTRIADAVARSLHGGTGHNSTSPDTPSTDAQFKRHPPALTPLLLTQPDESAPIASPQTARNVDGAAPEGARASSGQTPPPDAPLPSVAQGRKDARPLPDDPDRSTQCQAATLESDTYQEQERVDRLHTQADTQFEGADGRRRRSAVAHLKAAVMATKAEQKLDQTDHGDPLSAYRSDLASHVGTSHVEGQTADETVTAPLVLFSEQRVDGQDQQYNRSSPAQLAAMETHNRMPDPPLRIQSTRKPESFIVFSTKSGASSFEEILECAAAYIVIVEGRQIFSHPEIMRLATSFHDNVEITREAGLAAFGNLLRKGAIQQASRSEFSLSSNSRYFPSRKH
jgi:hypothetical protein